MIFRDEIIQSNFEFGNSEVDYRKLGQGGLEYADKITLSEDPRSLRINWAVTPEFFSSRDKIRVIVESDD